jgi:hypothetical protein
LGETLPKGRREALSTSGDRDVEDFYGKTEQIILFPTQQEEEEDEDHSCLDEDEDDSYCFPFKLPQEVRYEEISSVELWVYKLPDPNDPFKNHSFIISQEDSRDKDSKILTRKDGIRFSQGMSPRGFLT